MVKAKARQASVDDFIAAGENNISPSVTKKPAKPPRVKKFKPLTFSLSEDVSLTIERLSLVPRNFRCTRSDVIRAAIQALDNLPEAEQLKLLRMGKNSQ